MSVRTITIKLKQFHGSSMIYKHLYPGKSPLLMSEGIKYVRDSLNAFWLLDSLLIYQSHKALRDVKFQVWELNQSQKDLTWNLSCRSDTGTKPLISESIIDGTVILPSEY
jgi:hypothetical protein